jgi:hypothetical protein
MSLKKILKRGEKGQVIIEYFILFALIAAISIVSVSAIVSKTQETTEGFTNKAVHKLIPDLPMAGW